MVAYNPTRIAIKLHFTKDRHMTKQAPSVNHSVTPESDDLFASAIRRLDEAFAYAEIHPESLEIVCATSVRPEKIGILHTSLEGLRRQPHRDSLVWLWKNAFASTDREDTADE